VQLKLSALPDKFRGSSSARGEIAGMHIPYLKSAL
jgi:hypothetical protein